jgi:hypothetical protein
MTSVPTAKQYTKPDIYESYKQTIYQTTLPFNENGTRPECLTEEGLKHFNTIKTLAEQGTSFKNTFFDYDFHSAPTSMWLPDVKSPFYKSTDLTIWNSSNDLRLCGHPLVNGNITSKEENPTTTTVILFFTKEWIFTKSGSLYKLSPQMNRQPFLPIVNVVDSTENDDE